MPVKIAIYNHKGGVGKTTLTWNLAAAMAELGRSVLLVDSDPQCNLTSYLYNDDVVNDLLDKSDKSGGKTIWTALKPVVEGTGDIKLISPQKVPAANILVMPGDIRLAKYELIADQLWTDALQRRVRGYQGVTAVSRATSKFAGDMDYIFYDVGPNIGPLNRVVLLDCDYFIVPGALDLFSIRALKTLGVVVSDWVNDWRMIGTLAPDGVDKLNGRPRFLGYIVSTFHVRETTGSLQEAEYLSRFQKQVRSDVIGELRKVGTDLVPRSGVPKLAEIPAYGHLVHTAQSEGVPFWLATEDAKEQTKIQKLFHKLAERIETGIRDFTDHGSSRQ